MPNIDLARIYGEASREIKDELRAIDVLEFNAQKADGIRRKVRRLTLALDLVAKKWTDTDLDAAYVRGSRHVRVALEILGKKPRGPGVSLFPAMKDKVLETLVAANVSIRRTVDSFLDAALYGNNVALRAKVQELDRRKALQRFAEWGEEAVVTEISRGELGRKVFDYLLDELTDEGFIEIKGKFWNPRKYAKLVARTEMRKAAVEATLDSCRQYDNDLVQVSDEPAECDDCKDIVGKTFSLSGRDPEYPLLTFEIPLHPNCRHDLNPISREAIRAREIFG